MPINNIKNVTIKYIKSTNTIKILLKILFIYSLFILINIYVNYPNITLNNIINTNLGLLLELVIVTLIIILFALIKNHIFKILLISATIFVYYTLFILQMFSIELTGDVINLAGLNNIDQIMLLINHSMLLKSIIYIILFLFMLKLSLKNKNTTRRDLLIMFFVVSLVGLYILYYKRSHYIYSVAPIKTFFNTVQHYTHQRKQIVTELTKQEKQIAKKFNIHLDVNQSDPFEKKTLYSKPLPFKSLTNTPPNVIVFFIESLSARLLGSYNSQMHEVTPNINNFSEHSMVVKGYYNHATPTAPALYGQHCSLYPLYTYEDMDHKPNILHSLHFKCMPQYFSENDYETIYFSHSRQNYGNIKNDLILWGYKKSYLWKDFLNTFLKNEELILGETGLSDHQMMRGLTHYLQQNKKHNKPFFIGLSTIETHMGFKPNTVDSILYKEGRNDTLNMVHNFDDAFKIFWDYFQHSQYYNNTIVVLTGDHALYPNTDYQKVAGNSWVSSVYDELSLIIYDPIHQIPQQYTVNATSVDLAPSLLHLASIKKDSKNSFMGNSIFEPKMHNNTFGISAYPDFNDYLNLNGRIINKKMKKIHNKKIKNTIKSLTNILRYSNFIKRLNKAKALY